MKKSSYRLPVIVFAAVASVLPTQVSAQGLLGAIFEALGSRPSRSAPVQSYADTGNSFNPFGIFEPNARPAAPQGSGSRYTYCVRLCDGRYFPIARTNGAKPAELCSAMCPAARTQTFSGSQIAYASAPDGTRYNDLENAFVYREQVVTDCSCNGKDAFGLVPLDVNSDPTLRPGDIVATGKGLMAFQSIKSKRGAQTANFTPIEDYSRLSRDMRDKLANVTIATTN